MKKYTFFIIFTFMGISELTPMLPEKSDPFDKQVTEALLRSAMDPIKIIYFDIQISRAAYAERMQAMIAADAEHRQAMRAAYAERLKHPAPHEIKVEMLEQKEAHLKPQEKQKTLFTYGLSECTAAALIYKCTDGVWHAAMSHYPAIGHFAQIQISNMRRIAQQFATICKDGTTVKKLIVLAPGKWTKDKEGKFTIFKPNDADTHHIKKLEEAAGIEAEVYPYNIEMEEVFFETEPTHDFEIELTPGKCTWRSKVDIRKYHTITECKKEK